jgi:hypothetical protein
MNMETNPLSEQAIRDARKEGYEHRDTDVRTLAKFGLWLAVILVVIFLGMMGMFSYYAKSQQLGPPASPFDVENARVLPPSPRLQVAPRAELLTYRDDQKQELETYGWVDQANGVVRLPIDRAMDLLLQKGLPVRAEAADAAQGNVPTGANAKKDGK